MVAHAHPIRLKEFIPPSVHARLVAYTKSLPSEYARACKLRAAHPTTGTVVDRPTMDATTITTTETAPAASRSAADRDAMHQWKQRLQSDADQHEARIHAVADTPAARQRRQERLSGMHMQATIVFVQDIISAGQSESETTTAAAAAAR